MSGRKYQELENRTTQFGKNVVRFSYTLKKDYLIKPVLLQIIRSSSSIGANYREMNESRTIKEKIHILSIIKREINETLHWLSILEEANNVNPEILVVLKNECKELKNIFVTILFTLKRKN